MAALSLVEDSDEEESLWLLLEDWEPSPFLMVSSEGSLLPRLRLPAARPTLPEQVLGRLRAFALAPAPRPRP